MLCACANRIAALERRIVDFQQQIARLESESAERERDVVSLREHAAALAVEADKRGRYALDVQEHFDRCQAWAKLLQRKVRRFEEHFGLLPDTLPRPRPRYTAEDFVRFLYAALLHRSDALGPEVAWWADRLRAGATLLELFETFLATPEGTMPSGPPNTTAAEARSR